MSRQTLGISQTSGIYKKPIASSPTRTRKSAKKLGGSSTAGSKSQDNLVRTASGPEAKAITDKAETATEGAELVSPGAKKPAGTQNPGIFTRGLKAAWTNIQKPIFKISEGKDDFFYTPKTVINKVWTWKPVWVPASIGGGAIATGVIFGVIYKAALIGALGAFFSSHAGWATAAGIGAAVIAAGVFYLCMYAQHGVYKKINQAKASAEGKIAQQAEHIEDLKTKLGAAREAGYGEGFKAGNDQGILAGGEKGYQYGKEEGFKAGVEHTLSNALAAQAQHEGSFRPAESVSGSESSPIGSDASFSSAGVQGNSTKSWFSRSRN